VQKVEPGEPEKDPAGQAWHVLISVAPCAAEYVPAWQAVQVEAPAALHVPPVHTVWEVDPSVNFAVVHCASDASQAGLHCWVFATVLYPASAGRHCVLPALLENVPASQGVHVELPRVLVNVPGGHCWHVLVVDFRA
jgi:hypothetical protein